MLRNSNKANWIVRTSEIDECLCADWVSSVSWNSKRPRFSYLELWRCLKIAPFQKRLLICGNKFSKNNMGLPVSDQQTTSFLIRAQLPMRIHLGMLTWTNWVAMKLPGAVFQSTVLWSHLKLIKQNLSLDIRALLSVSLWYTVCWK